MNNKTTGLKNIAYALGLSINTVSRALRDCNDISEATKEKVRQKAYEMGYMPTNISQFIKRDGIKLVAIVINSLKNLFFSAACEKLINLLTEQKYDFTIVFSHSKTFDLDLLKQCISQRVDGVITLLEPTDSTIENAKLNGIPLVLLGRQINKPSIDELYIDDEMGGQLVANYLANYHKIRKFVYIKIPNIECSLRRQRAFQHTLKKLDPSYECIVLDKKNVKGKLLNLINDGYFGIFCFNDELVYETLKTLNQEIPNIRKTYPMVHIIGFDCLSTKIDGLEDVTSIDYDYDSMCLTALKLLQERFDDPQLEKRSIKFGVTLHQRRR